MIAVHSSSRTPLTISGRWLILFASSTLIDEPNAPPLISGAPYTTLFILDWIIAPLHIMHGSTVTYKSQSTSLQLLSFLLALVMASISACEETRFFFSLLLWPRAITLSSLTIIQPLLQRSHVHFSPTTRQISIKYSSSGI